MSMIASGALALALAGCGVPKEAGFPDVRTAVEARVPQKIAWNQGTAADADVASAVRKLLGHALSVSDVVQIALLNNRELQAGYEELMVSQADVVEAGLLRNPTFSAGIQLPINTSAPLFHLGVEQDFLSLLLLPARKRLASAMFEATKARVGHQIIEFAFDVRIAFFRLQGAEQVVAMQGVILETADAALELATRQHEAGNINELDLNNEWELFDRNRIAQRKSQAEIIGLREDLNRRMGLFGKDTQWTLAQSLPPVPDKDPPLDGLETLAMNQRLDVAAAIRSVEAQYRALGMTKNWRWLGDGVTLGADFEGEPDGAFLGPTLALELPIFNQGQAEIARRGAATRQAEASLYALAVHVRSEVRQARAQVQFARNLAQHYKNVVIPRRERRVALVQDQYDAMLMGVFQLIQAKQDEIDAYREYIEATRDYWIARAELDRAVGKQLGADPPTVASGAVAPAPPTPPTSPSGHQHHH